MRPALHQHERGARPCGAPDPDAAEAAPVGLALLAQGVGGSEMHPGGGRGPERSDRVKAWSARWHSRPLFRVRIFRWSLIRLDGRPAYAAARTMRVPRWLVAHRGLARSHSGGNGRTRSHVPKNRQLATVEGIASIEREGRPGPLATSRRKGFQSAKVRIARPNCLFSRRVRLCFCDKPAHPFPSSRNSCESTDLGRAVRGSAAVACTPCTTGRAVKSRGSVSREAAGREPRHLARSSYTGTQHRKFPGSIRWRVVPRWGLK